MILLGLNELNVDFIKGYIKAGKLKNFAVLLENGVTSTISEVDYELLEPWIQWVTVHTGKKFAEHKIFRLGDIIYNKSHNQIFEDLEAQGLIVGAISPFNADNRLRNAAFFIPDPWTETKASGGKLIKYFSKSISRIVNNNASGKFGILDLIGLLTGFLIFVRVKKWPRFFTAGLRIKKPGMKAAILDMILLEVFVTLQKKHKPDYSHLFFNGGAHIQHHYMFNSTQYDGGFVNPEWHCPKGWDPVLMILECYDNIIGDLLKTGERIVGVTGLHQIPHQERTYMWRPISHKAFLIEAGVHGLFKVTPRMSRDFLIEVGSDEDATEIEKHLNQFRDSVRQKAVFNVDNRGMSLFVEVVYDDELVDGMTFIGPNGISIASLETKLAFVTIKNGAHDGLGYVFSNMPMNLPEQIELEAVYDFIKHNALADAGAI
ncbi:MAG: hypothetical protein ACPGAO_08875 [Flavobacteriaceae bacterium]